MQTVASFAALAGVAAAQAYGAAPPAYSSAPACPAPGTTGSQGYSCNPAHQYPEGQECNLSNGCYILTTVSVDTPVYTPAPSSPSAYHPPAYTTASSASCPAPGTTGSQGYSCNPAHQYPEGQQCNLSNGCYILTTVSVDVPVYTPAPSTPPAYHPPASPTPACPAPGTTGSQGYSCNPAHQYPEGQQCNLSNGCYILTTVSVDVPAYTPAPSSPKAPVAPPAYTPAASMPPASMPPKYTPGASMPPASMPPAYTPGASMPPANKPSGSMPPVVPGPSSMATVPGTPGTPGTPGSPSAPSATGSVPSSSMVPYTGGAGKVVVGGTGLVAALFAVFAL